MRGSDDKSHDWRVKEPNTLEDNSHAIWNHNFPEYQEMRQNRMSSAVMIGTLKIYNMITMLLMEYITLLKV